MPIKHVITMRMELEQRGSLARINKAPNWDGRVNAQDARVNSGFGRAFSQIDPATAKT